MQKKGLSIIIPTFNESANIKLLIKKLVWIFIEQNIPYEIIVVDDHSTDQTRRIVSACSKEYPVRLINKKGKQGKGYSILEGFAESMYGYIAILDGDTDTEELEDYFVRLMDLAHQNGFAFARIKRTPLARALSMSPFQGPKIFRREIFDHIDKNLVSAWVIGTPLIETARELGFRGASLRIGVTHVRRPKSVLVRLQRGIEIMRASLKSIVSARPVFSFLPDSIESMKGAGLAYKRHRFVTHTTLPVHLSALTTFAPWQIGALLATVIAVSVGVVLDTRHTLIAVTAILSLIYLLDVIFNLVVTLKSLRVPPELTITDRQIALLKDRDLPVYSVLCPLYKEAQVLPQFVDAMETLNWPKNKLDVLLLLEEDDKETIKAAQNMNLPAHFRVVVVPDSNPKTKPKACNYGLAFAKGEYIVIFDAEDKPDPDQLKKAYIAFRESDKKVACLQAKLNYYNPNHNLLTRLFTAEYSLWFDVILPGLQSINTSIPLGGTSNHFRTAVLRDLHGWDPFNVTEDADLGTRLFSAGYKTAIIDSTTLEEANSDVKNWFRQRSRWLKGYMQTYLVHMRRPFQLMKQQGWHYLVFQLVVGGKISFILINPLLWIMTLSYFVLYPIVGVAIESIYPAPVFYMAATSLLVGNFIAFYNYMIGCIKKGHFELVKFVFLIPFYWMAISGAALIALYQLIIRPHYWEKTIHGLHLLKPAAKATSTVAQSHRIQKIADVISSTLTAGGVMVVAAMFGNIMNFLYNSYLSRNLDLAAFGEISLFSSFLYISSIPLSSLSRTITHTSARLLGKYGKPVKELWFYYRKRLLQIGIGCSIIWLVCTPLLQKFFQVDAFVPFLLFAPVWIISAVGAANGGFLGGNLIFVVMALSVVVETLVKFGTAAALVTTGMKEWVYAAIPISLFVAFVVEWWQIAQTKSEKIEGVEPRKDFRLSKRFYATSILTTLTAATYLSLDLILAKHFLSPVDAGAYSYISLAGKMVFYLGSIFSQFLIPYVSRDIGAGKDPKKSFYRLLGLVALVNVVSYGIFGVFGRYTAPLLWGHNAQLIVPFLPRYALAMVFFSLTSVIVTYQQVRGRYVFPVIGFVVGLIQVGGMYLRHGSVNDLVNVVVVCSAGALVSVSVLSYFYQSAVDAYQAIIDFVGLFRPLPASAPLQGGKLRILIFNWRDLRHQWAGGAEVYIDELSRRWVKMGHKVTIFAGNDRRNKRFENREGVNIIRRGGFYFVYVWAFAYYIFRLRGRYDIIIDSENGLPFFTPLYAKEKTYLLIHHVHQEVFRKSLIPPFSWIASFLEKTVMPAVYRNTEVITVSPSSKAEILAHKLTTKDPAIMYNGVDLKKCKPGVKSRRPMVLYLGRLTTAKSIHVLLRAAKNIIAQIPDVEIVIAGAGPSQSSLVRLSKALGVSSNVRFTGKVNEEEKVRLYQQAWVFVNPSLIEGWGITTIEANACGTPVVASNVAGLRDAVHNPHSGLLVPYGDVGEFESAILRLLQNTRLRTRMSRESIVWAKKFDWAKSAELGIKLLQSEENHD